MGAFRRKRTDKRPDGATRGVWTPEVLQEIRQRVDLVELVAEHVQLRPQGRNLVGRCPFHDDRSPSFSVSPEKQVFYCFGCQASGDAFSFVMRREGLDFAGAVAWLAKRAGVQLPERASSPAALRQRRRQDELAEALAAAASYYHEVLCRSPVAEEARAYLRRRGVSDATRDRFGLGYAPPGDVTGRVLAAKGYGPDLLEEAGLLVRSPRGGRHDRFRGRIMFPIRDDRERVVGFGGRVLGDGVPKYLNSPETILFSKRRLLFALDVARRAIRETGRAVVVEGYMDAIAAHQHGFANVVAALGTALSEEQALLLRRHTAQVVIAFDADAAGAQATLRGLEIFRRLGCDVRVAVVPEGKDPDEFLRARGGAAFGAVLEQALPLIEYVFECAAAREDLTSVTGKVNAVRALVPYLAGEENAVAQAGYIQRLAGRLGIPEESLRLEVHKYIRSRLANKGRSYNKRNDWDTKRGPAPVAAGVEPAAGTAAAERRLLGLLVREPGLREAVRRRVDPADFEVEAHRALAEALWEEGRAADEILDRVDDPVVRDLAAALLMEEEGEADPIRVAEDCVSRIERRRWQRRLEALDREMAALAGRGEPIPPELGQEWQQLQRRIRGSSR